MATTIGVISDTHGRLPAQVEHLFAGVDRIIHAGDVCATRVLTDLGRIAPVSAVAGNCDRDETAHLPGHLFLEVEGVTIVVAHEARHALEAAPPGARVVVSGHTHRSSIQRVGDVLRLNPGSASDSRGEGRSVALLRIEGEQVSARIARL